MEFNPISVFNKRFDVNLMPGDEINIYSTNEVNEIIEYIKQETTQNIEKILP